MKSEIIFTSENLIENIEKLGPWSAYGLAEEAIHHYKPWIKYVEDPTKQIQYQVNALKKIGCESWHDIIIKYAKEGGYGKGREFSKDYVNEY